MIVDIFSIYSCFAATLLISLYIVCLPSNYTIDGRRICNCHKMTHELVDVESVKGVKLVHMNVRSLLPHFEEVSSLLTSGNIDILVLGETWLHSRVSDGLINIDNYDLYRLDRQTVLPSGIVKRGGGVCVYIKSSFAVTNWTSLAVSNSDLELMSLSCKLGNSRKLNIHAAYRPPSGKVQSAVDLLKRNFDEVKLKSSGDNIIIGDMNFDLLKRDRHANCFLSLASSCSLNQLINSPTRFFGNNNSLLDHIYTDMDYVSKVGTLSVDISDHLPTFLIRKKEHNHIAYKQVYGRSYKNLVTADFLSECSRIDFQSIFQSDDPEQAWELLLSCIMYIVEKHCPMRVQRIPVSKPEYLTDQVLKLMHNRDKAFKIVRKDPTPAKWANARHLRTLVSREIRKAKRVVILRHLENAKGDGAKFWKFINNSFFATQSAKITQIREEGQVLEGRPAADAVNRYFCNVSKVLSVKFDGCPQYSRIISTETTCSHVDQISVRRTEEAINKIDTSKSSGIPGLPSKLLKLALKAIPEIFTALLNLSIAKAVFPQQWKLAQVVCLPKGGNLLDLNKIRPISLLPITGKILETFINERLVSHLEKNHLLSPNQYGFRRGRSTTDCCLGLVDEIYKAGNSSGS